MNDVFIVGAGFSGIMCAINLKRLNSKLDVTIIEKDNRIGRKILQTGNGRCNIANINLDSKFYNNDYVRLVFDKYNLDYLIKYLNSIGIILDIEEDRYYPSSFSAKSLLEILKININKYQIKIIYNEEVVDIKNKEIITKNNKRYKSNFIVISSGSLINKELFNNINQPLTKLYPSLTGFIVEKKLNDIKGVRIKGLVTLLRDNKEIKNEYGEIQIKEDGFSGICVMNLSSYYQENDYLKIDLFPQYNLFELELFLKENKVKEYKFFNIYTYNLANYLFNKYQNKSEKELSFIFKNFIFKIKGLYDNYQVIKGGINLNYISNFESKINKDIFFTGEVLDINGLCGGYNLMWALGSSLYVSNFIVEKIKNMI